MPVFRPKAKPSKKGENAGPPSRFRRRAIVFTVGFLASFFLVWMLGMPPAQFVAVRAMVAWPSAPGAAEFADLRPDELGSDEFLRGVVDQIGADDSPAERAATLAEFRRGLQAQFLGLDEEGRQRLVIEYRGAHPQAAAAVNRVAESTVTRFSDGPSKAQRTTLDAATAARLEAEGEVQAAKRELDRYCGANTELLALVDKPSTGAASAEPWPRVSAPQPRRVAERESDNPVWQSLRSAMDEQDARRNALLVTMSPLHPSVQAIDLELDDLRKRIAGVPKYLTSVDSFDSPSLADSLSPVAEQPPVPVIDEATVAAAKERREFLRAELATREAALAAAIERQEAAQVEWRGASQSAMQVVERAEPVPPIAPRGYLTWISALIGIVFATGLSAKCLPVDSVFRSIDEVAAELSVPIVGVLKARDHVDAQPPARPPRGVTVSLLACYGLLAVTLLATLSRAVADPGFFGELAARPLPVLSESVRQFLR